MSEESLRLLVVDDDEVDRLAVRRALRSRAGGVELHDCDSAERAVELIARQRFDCVLLDLQLPEHDGLWALNTLRERKLTVPVIILTGQGDELTAVHLIKAGAADYLPKSALSAETLLPRIRQVVRTARAEAELSRSREAQRMGEERLRLALESANVGTWGFDYRAGEMSCDDRCRALFGVGAAPLTREVLFAAIHPEDLAEVRRKVAEVLRPGSEGRYRAEFRTCPAGCDHPVWLLAQGRVTFGEQGHPLRFMGTVIDVTERKEREEALRRASEFEQQLLAIVSHDIRNPLQAITMSIAVARARAPNDERLQKSLNRISAGTERMNGIVRDLLDLTHARIGAGLPVQSRRVDLHQITQRVVEEHRAAHPHRELRQQGDAELFGDWDAGRVEQLLANLVSNAIHYSPDDTPVTVGCRRDGDRAELTVHNWGTPIPSEAMSQLFAPFKRNRPDAQTRSLGLGLFIVERIAGAHGGTVDCRSSAESGTEFRISLPVSPPR